MDDGEVEQEECFPGTCHMTSVAALAVKVSVTRLVALASGPDAKPLAPPPSSLHQVELASIALAAG